MMPAKLDEEKLDLDYDILQDSFELVFQVFFLQCDVVSLAIGSCPCSDISRG